MRRFSSPLLIALLLIFCGRSVKDHNETKLVLRPLIQPEAAKIEGPKIEEPEIKAATPEDPGPVATVVGPLAAWTQQATPAPPEQPLARRPSTQPIDRLVYFDAGKPKHLLHSVFSVNKRSQFVFVVPPHQSNARLCGTFRSFTNRNDPDSSDRTANLDLILLNEQEFNQSLQGQPQSVTYELNSVHNQMVDWRVPATYKDAQTYHLIFSNSESVTKTKFVEADFTVSFE